MPTTTRRSSTLLVATLALTGVIVASPVGKPTTAKAEAITAAETSSGAGPDDTATPTPDSNPDTTPDTIPGSAPVTAPAPGIDNEPPATDTPREPSRWVRVIVDLSEQELVILDQHGKTLHTWDVSSGSPKTPTPVGRYRVTSKSRRTFAVANPDVTMEHMVRFKGGIGFHAIPRLRGTPLTTPLGERGVSHGCVRLADANARLLYRNLPVGAEVVVRP
jgi:lipoprotein-anchoring transpeptidase ErfK/SrfK